MSQGLPAPAPITFPATNPSPNCDRWSFYVVAVVGDPKSNCDVKANYLKKAERQRWVPSEPVIYIGQTTRPLSRRIREFYRHQYGKRSPHSGGQAVKLLKCQMWVYWSPANDPLDAELLMLCAFRKKVGRLPFANRG